MLKSKVAAVLSLSGILASGSAAALVNTQVLASETKSNAPVTATLAVTTTSTTPSSIPTQTPPSLTSTQATYQVGAAGVVVLDTAGDTLSVVSAKPGSGWIFVEAENYGPNAVEVKFRDGTTEVEFKATLLVGVVSTSIESELINDQDDDNNESVTSSIPSTSVPGTSIPGSTSSSIKSTTSTTIDDDDNKDDDSRKSGSSRDRDDKSSDDRGGDRDGDDD